MTNEKIIDSKQIRAVTTAAGKEKTFSVTQKISSFFDTVITSPSEIEAKQNEKILQTDVTFVQIKEILNYIDPALVEKIPEKMRNFILSYKSFINYAFKYDTTKSLEDQFMYEDTKSLIAYFDYSYWANEEDKKLIELTWLDKGRENAYDFSGNENTVKFSTFESNTQNVQTNSVQNSNNDVQTNNEPTTSDNSLVETNEEINTTETSLVVRKENFFIRLINKIKEFFFGKHSESEAEEFTN